MKGKLFSILYAVTSLAGVVPVAYANGANMCGPATENYVDPSSVMCEPEQSSFSYDYGYDGPSIRQGHWSDQLERTPPQRRNFFEEAETMTNNPLSAPIYGITQMFGSSHDSSMNWSQLGEAAWGIMDAAGSTIQDR